MARYVAEEKSTFMKNIFALYIVNVNNVYILAKSFDVNDDYDDYRHKCDWARENGPSRHTKL